MLSIAGQRIYDPFRIYLGTGHLVDQEISRLLITTQLLFYFEEENIRRMTLNDIGVPTKINFNYLTRNHVDSIIRKLDVHQDRKYKIDNPFNFNYEFFGYYLDPSKEFNKILSAWSDIMINEWQVVHGFRLFMGFGYDKFSEQLHIGNIPLELKGITKNEIDMVKETGVNLVLLRGLWLANNIIIRLQALWDKMITEFLLKSYFSCKTTGKRLSSRLNKLKQISEDTNLTTDQKDLLSKFIEMSNTITELRKWRDHDVHMVSEAIQGVYSRNHSDENLYQLWNRIIDLHNITREAIFSLIGFIALGHKYSPELVLRVVGECKQLKNKFYNPTNDDEKMKLQELQNFGIKRNINKNVRRVKELLMDLWNIKTASEDYKFIVISRLNLPNIIR
jgi:hypothetical protein